MATGPNERRAKSEQTNQEAKRIIDAEGEAHRVKTGRLKAQRLERELAEKRAAAEKAPKPAARKARPRKKEA